MEHAEKIAAALRAQGFEASVMTDAAEPGEDIPIHLVIDGEDFALNLGVL